MSVNKYDYLRNVCQGRTDWKIKIRIIREWRGKASNGELFKNYNLLLLDAKQCRMQAFIPTYLSDKMQRMFKVGKMYIVSNFQVKNFTTDDKWRSVNMDRQIHFTNHTKAREIPENDYYIPNNMFDFYALEELHTMANQNLYLADVVGVIIKRHDIKPVHTSKGKDQLQVKLKITYGRCTINVTFWDTLAEEFQNEIDTQEYELPLIIIVASAKVSKWKDVVDICNFSPTTFYINYNHHSVTELRKIIPHLPKQNEASTSKRRLQMFTVEQIKNFTADYIDEKVVCQIQIKKVEEVPTWYYSVCTSCYKQIKLIDNSQFCETCNRIVPEPDKKFGICVVAADMTGDIGIVLMDRPIRTLFGKRVFDLDQQYNGNFPMHLKSLENGEYTVKLQISEENIGNKDELYLATDIFSGFELLPGTVEEVLDVRKLSEHFTQQPSGISYHLDNISQLNDEHQEMEN